jgi:hypothetical protein
VPLVADTPHLINCEFWLVLQQDSFCCQGELSIKSGLFSTATIPVGLH